MLEYYATSPLLLQYICYYHIDITVHPQSVNTTLNSTVNFTCEANTLNITFLVNGTIVISQGFIPQGVEDLGNGTWRRVILAEAIEDNNSTNISCRANNSKIVYSDIAVLRIQGKLML